MIQCTRCGAFVPDNTKICSTCGATIQPAASAGSQGGELIFDPSAPFSQPVNTDSSASGTSQTPSFPSATAGHIGYDPNAMFSSPQNTANASYGYPSHPPYGAVDNDPYRSPAYGTIAYGAPSGAPSRQSPSYVGGGLGQDPNAMFSDQRNYGAAPGNPYTPPTFGAAPNSSPAPGGGLGQDPNAMFSDQRNYGAAPGNPYTPPTFGAAPNSSPAPGGGLGQDPNAMFSDQRNYGAAPGNPYTPPTFGAAPNSNPTPGGGLGQDPNAMFSGNQSYNPNRMYQQQLPSESEIDDKARTNAKIIHAAAAVISVLAVLAIIVMVVSGYYTSSGNQTNTALPADAGDLSEVPLANTIVDGCAVRSGAYTFYLSGSTPQFSLCRVQGTCPGKGEVKTLCSSAHFMDCLNLYQQKLYYVSGGTVFSVPADTTKDPAPATPKTEFGEDGEIYGLYIYGDRAYYTITSFGSAENSGALFCRDLTTGKVSTVAAVSDSYLEGVAEYGDYVFFLAKDKATDAGTLYRAALTDLSFARPLQPLSDTSGNIRAFSVGGGKVYFSVFSGTDVYRYRTYSMLPDGTQVQELIHSGGEILHCCGTYLFYIVTSGASAGSPAEYKLVRARQGDSEEVTVSQKLMVSPSYIDNTIFYFDSQRIGYAWTTMDGSASGQ